ncbi:hypothetical protein GT354_01505 [Streptomyces sp. SID3343]|nr:hypothetical protein [Streptomyces sp. SID3343]
MTTPLSRLRRLTAAARRITEQNLHDRFALVGPVDEIKEPGDTIDAMLVRLERSFAANRRFAAKASHELRTPLALQRTSGNDRRRRPTQVQQVRSVRTGLARRDRRSRCRASAGRREPPSSSAPGRP